MLAATSSVDDDADGLTNTQESWWCINPLAVDSDNDGVSDGNEVNALKRWMGNTDVRPSTGKPFLGWPTGSNPPCYDTDRDSIPDLAERWDLGLNANKESTDEDRYDDGQELFGSTNCPGGGGACGYGLLPHVQDGSLVSSDMPTFVKAPGNHPLAAGFPAARDRCNAIDA